ncbi:DUF924 family protein [Aspergillus novofumigatus IBT 16806]|uniref:DUF924-domain-containing protein n=1 Tax=Aspergillus novofumigatus (strain IBT 16806) TaxID=1392255 RepID=A0A2I1CFL8_ASPN1|nr:DUF924-domain-containing protein [Aspergillus novofumigatus IBT 16806]PKX96414.1 DUF924-domain-containing protein [Aspergillus novofumigatus IBT 16806]
MANQQTTTLDQLLVPSPLPRIYTFWFQHIPSNERLLLPSPEDWMKWFFKSDEFDSACTLASPHHPPGPTPRNIYRGESSRIGFEFFDPLARTIAVKAGEAGYPAGSGSSSPFRYRQGQRVWFYMPLIHAEDLDMQDLARVKYAEMAEDFTSLLDGDATGLSDDEAECRRILLENRARLEEQLKTHFRVQREHYDPIARFGRFPHRNAALGRETSEEERRFLAEGKTFG